MAASDPVSSLTRAPSRLDRLCAVATDGRAVAVACAAGAVLSLLAPSVPDYDPWGWLVWGREVLHLDLDTTAGPSWKPLPVLFTAALAVFGPAAPALWLVLLRAAGLFGVALVFRLAARLAGPWAGVVACAALLLTPDGEAEWVRYMVQGELEPLLVTLCLWAVERHLDGRREHAFALATLVGLARPEIWPFLAVYALVLWRDPARRRFVVVALAVIPLLWFGGDWWGSGSPLTGGDRARILGDEVNPAVLAVRRSAAAVIPPVWLAAGVAVASALRRRDPGPSLLALAALAWMAIVVASTMTFGFAALSRFLAPAAALLCVLAGAGAAQTVAATGPNRARRAVVVALVVASLPFAVPRVVALRQQAVDALVHAAVQRDLDRALEEAGGPPAVLACGALATDPDYIAARPALAWKAGVAMSRVDHRIGEGPGVTFELLGGPRTGRLASEPSPAVRRLAQAGYWGVFAIDCPAAAHGG